MLLIKVHVEVLDSISLPACGVRCLNHDAYLVGLLWFTANVSGGVCSGFVLCIFLVRAPC